MNAAPSPSLHGKTSWVGWIPLFLVAACIAALAAIWIVPAEVFPRGAQMSATFVAAVIALVAACVWVFLFSGLTQLALAAVAVAAVAVIAVAAASVRLVEFSGNMVPTFEFRWQESRDARLAAHRRGLGNGAPQTAMTVDLTRVSAEDSPQYRGPARDGVVVGPALALDWSRQPPKAVWRQPVGGGFAAFVVVGDTAITIEQRREQNVDLEAVVAYDTRTGRERWVHEYPALFSESLGGNGPRATPTVADGRVYAFGATGILSCLDGASGKSLWTVDVHQLNQSQNVQWGMCSSPLVYDGLVVVVPGSQKGSEASRLVLAFRAENGERLWGQGRAQAAYSSPALATLRGQRQIIVFDAVGLAGFDDAGGGELWRHPTTAPYDNAAAQPLVLAGDRVFFSNESGCGLLRIAQGADGKWSATPLWENRNLKCAYANPVVVGNHVYGLDQGILACLDLKTGRRVWKSGKARYGHGQLLLSGELLLVLTEGGELALVEATPEAFHERGKVPALEGKTWNNPALVRGRAYIRNHLEMACYELPLRREIEQAAGNDHQ